LSAFVQNVVLFSFLSMGWAGLGFNNTGPLRAEPKYHK